MGWITAILFNGGEGLFFPKKSEPFVKDPNWKPPPTTFIEFKRVVLVARTTKAGLFRFGSGKEVWLPWSKVNFIDGTVTVPDWLCSNNGLYNERRE